jgi:hypothetical protein
MRGKEGGNCYAERFWSFFESVGKVSEYAGVYSDVGVQWNICR